MYLKWPNICLMKLYCTATPRGLDLLKFGELGSDATSSPARRRRQRPTDGRTDGRAGISPSHRIAYGRTCSALDSIPNDTDHYGCGCRPATWRARRALTQPSGPTCLRDVCVPVSGTWFAGSMPHLSARPSSSPSPPTLREGVFGARSLVRSYVGRVRALGPRYYAMPGAMLHSTDETIQSATTYDDDMPYFFGFLILCKKQAPGQSHASLKPCL